MINPDLEKRYADCTELSAAWKDYLEFYNKAVKEDGELTPELEAKFMECKGTIAMLHDSLMESLKEDRDIGQNMLAIVNRSITLKHVRRLGQADKKKIEIEWHECYLQLNETVSVLAEQREKLAKVSKFQERMGKLSESAHVGTHNFFTSLWFRLIVIGAIIAALVIFVPWSTLRDYGTPGKWYQAVLDFSRDELGLIDAPYGSIERFANKHMAATAPEGISISMDDLPAESNFTNRLRFLDVLGQNGADFLASREGYHQRKFNLNINQRQNTVNVAAFFWYPTSRAENFENALKTAQFDQAVQNQITQNQVRVLRVHNVIVVMWGGVPEARERIAKEVFGES